MTDRSELIERKPKGVAEFEAAANLLGGARTFGRELNGPFDAHEMLLHRLPAKALSHLVKSLVTMEWVSLEKALGMSLRTDQRRKGAPEKPLNQEQSERTWKFAEILAKATATFGSQDDAEHWLESPAIGLDRQPPIDLLATRAGAEMVENLLKQLEYGVYL